MLNDPETRKTQKRGILLELGFSLLCTFSLVLPLFWGLWGAAAAFLIIATCLWVAAGLKSRSLELAREDFTRRLAAAPLSNQERFNLKQLDEEYWRLERKRAWSMLALFFVPLSIVLLWIAAQSLWAWLVVVIVVFAFGAVIIRRERRLRHIRKQLKVAGLTPTRDAILETGF